MDSDLGNIVQVAPDVVTDTRLFRKLEYPYPFPRFLRLTHGKPIGIDPSAIDTFKGIDNGRKVVMRA